METKFNGKINTVYAMDKISSSLFLQPLSQRVTNILKERKNQTRHVLRSIVLEERHQRRIKFNDIFFHSRIKRSP